MSQLNLYLLNDLFRQNFPTYSLKNTKTHVYCPITNTILQIYDLDYDIHRYSRGTILKSFTHKSVFQYLYEPSAASNLELILHNHLPSINLKEYASTETKQLILNNLKLLTEIKSLMPQSRLESEYLV